MKRTQSLFSGNGNRIAGYVLIAMLVLPVKGIFAQSITQKLQNAFRLFEQDSQLAHAISSLYVIDAKTGNVVFEKNAQTGLAPASTQKIITSATALAILGQDYRYQTKFGIDDQTKGLIIFPSGDPTLGSERWNNTKAAAVLSRIIQSLSQKKSEYHAVVSDNRHWEPNTIPDGWIWQDVGNYYGAGAAKLNWRENQYDLLLQSGNNVGEPVHITRTHPKLFGYGFKSEVTSAAAGTGDNAYIYFPLNGSNGIITGTIPVHEKGFGISGALPSGEKQFIEELKEGMLAAGIKLDANETNSSAEYAIHTYGNDAIVHTETSPSLDSIVYWFNKKSINLYGEALLKTMAVETRAYGSTDSGINVVKDFWKQNGLDPLELNMVDGSGLSPLNRVTTHAQVKILRHAQKQSWFKAFYNSLPEYNGMKMKSGTIRNVKGFCGYHTAANGATYIFSFLVNNYNGSPSGLVRKMYSVLDILK